MTFDPGHDVDKPMGNAELRLSLAGIESEISDVKGIAMETRDQARKTNGRVTLLEKFMWTMAGLMPFMTAAMGWLSIDYIKHRNQASQIPTTQLEAAVDQAFVSNLSRLK